MHGWALKCPQLTCGWQSGVIVHDWLLVVTPEAGISRVMLSDINSTC